MLTVNKDGAGFSSATGGAGLNKAGLNGAAPKSGLPAAAIFAEQVDIGKRTVPLKITDALQSALGLALAGFLGPDEFRISGFRPTKSAGCCETSRLTPPPRGTSCISCRCRRGRGRCGRPSGRPPPVLGPLESVAAELQLCQFLLLLALDVAREVLHGALGGQALLLAAASRPSALAVLFASLLFVLLGERQHRAGVRASPAGSRGSAPSRPRCGPSWR